MNGRPLMDFHARATSLGTKRGIAPYWARYHRGKDRALKCPWFAIREKTPDFVKCYTCSVWGETCGDARRLFGDRCGVCDNRDLIFAIRPVLEEAEKRVRYWSEDCNLATRRLNDQVSLWRREYMGRTTGYHPTIQEFTRSLARWVAESWKRVKEARAELVAVQKRYDEAYLKYSESKKGVA